MSLHNRIAALERRLPHPSGPMVTVARRRWRPESGLLPYVTIPAALADRPVLVIPDRDLRGQRPKLLRRDLKPGQDVIVIPVSEEVNRAKQ
jgi:hypothetical protein